VSQLFIRLW